MHVCAATAGLLAYTDRGSIHIHDKLLSEIFYHFEPPLAGKDHLAVSECVHVSVNTLRTVMPPPSQNALLGPHDYSWHIQRVKVAPGQ